MTDMRKIFCLPNSTSQIIDASIESPWAFNGVLPESLKTKTDYRRWCGDPNTRHCFFNTWEPEHPGMRVSEENPPVRAHGLVADFDAVLSDDDIRGSVARMAALAYEPFAWNRTFSGGLRVVWLFEEPIFYRDREYWKKLLGVIEKELKIDVIAPGLDRNVLEATHVYCCGGGNWQVSGVMVPKGVVHSWDFRVAEKYDWSKHGNVHVPLETAWSELSKKYGEGFWAGEFGLGSRGTRFWDNGDARSVILREAGFQCFTGDKPFMYWSDEELLGKKFTKAFQDSRLGEAINDLWFDGNKFWAPCEGAMRWGQLGSEGVKRRLKITYGLGSKAAKGEEVSEIERVLHAIEKTKQFKGFIPLPGDKKDRINLGQGLYLNSSRRAALAPEEGEPAWGENFEWIAKWWDQFFDEEAARDNVLAWLAWFYKGVHEQTWLRGHNLLLVGPPKSGKTLFANAIVGGLVGGACDAEPFLTGSTVFNAGLADHLVWALDDPSVGGDRRRMQALTEKLKSLSVNPFYTYNQAHGTKSEIPFRGRIVMSLNDDPESLDMLPAVSESMNDKLIIARTSKVEAELPADRKLGDRILAKELPWFAAWLLRSWKPTDRVKMGGRMGLHAYHDLEILQTAGDSTASSIALSLFMSFVDWYWREDVQGATEDLVVTNTDLLGMILECPKLRMVARNLTQRSLGLALAKLIKDGHTPWLSKKMKRISGKPAPVYVISKPPEGEE